MKGILIKDIFNMKEYWLIATILYVVHIILICYKGEGIYNIVGLTALLCGIIPLQAMLVDEKSRWNKYAVVLPTSRSSIAISKYILAGMTFALSYGILGIVSLTMSSFSAVISGEILLSCMLITIFYDTILIPISFLFGAEKSSIFVIVIFWGSVIGIYILMKVGVSAVILESVLQSIVFWGVGAIVLIVASLCLSIRICEGKEF